jgi:hypothetical protein
MQNHAYERGAREGILSITLDRNTEKHVTAFEKLPHQ